ncbi:rhamnogalacturonan acetylesterase [Sphingobium aquiterrae]|uniref:rhamnogalacturonan acetylesterase n=1 Tax=Sphingobium aquiterrae TaxID=2038656 RepID=UPI00301A7B10
MRRLALIAALAFAPPAAAQPAPDAAERVFIASDSTAAAYPADQYPQMGWGMFLRCALPASAQVVNMARGGRSTKTYREEALWAVLLTQVRPGDTVLIQFGHNDEDMQKPWRHTEAKGDFTANLTAMVADVRRRQAVPVLLTPVARDAFANGRIQETHGDHALAVRDVAAATGTPLIDLNADSMAFLDRAGETGAKRYFMIYTPADGIARFPQGHVDTTHLNELGARAIAALVAQGLGGLGVPIAARVRAAAPDSVRALGDSTCP